MRIGLLYIFLTALFGLFVGLLAFTFLFPVVVPVIINEMDRLVPQLGTPQTVKFWEEFKGIIYLVFASLPVVLVVATVIFIVTRSGRYEEDVVYS